MAADSFLAIGITPPQEEAGEAERIVALLDGCLDFMHLRRPGCGEDEMRRIIERLPARCYPQLKLHSHFHLVEEYGLGGVHLNSRCPEYDGPACSRSRSCHSEQEAALSEGFDYVTLSPVYNSISKPGYKSRFHPSVFRIQMPHINVIALGGVAPSCFRELREAGFAGAAMLGCLWLAAEKELADIIDSISREKN